MKGPLFWHFTLSSNLIHRTGPAYDLSLETLNFICLDDLSDLAAALIDV